MRKIKKCRLIGRRLKKFKSRGYRSDFLNLKIRIKFEFNSIPWIFFKKFRTALNQHWPGVLSFLKHTGDKKLVVEHKETGGLGSYDRNLTLISFRALERNFIHYQIFRNQKIDFLAICSEFSTENKISNFCVLLFENFTRNIDFCR